MPLTSTTLAAHASLSPSRVTTIREAIVEILSAAGAYGCIFDDLRQVFPKTTADGTIRARIIELESDDVIFRAGDTRRAPTNCDQLVMRMSEFRETVASPSISKRKKNPFLEGMKFAAKVVLSESDFDGAKLALKRELIKVASR